MSAPPIVLLGASFAAGWRLPVVAGIPVLNKAIGGQHSFDMLERFDRDVVALHPRAVILWGYLNDIFDAPDHDFDKASAGARTAFEAMIARARAAGIEPILATEIPIRGRDSWRETLDSWIAWARGRATYSQTINGPVDVLNVWLRQTAAREHLLLLDLSPVVRDSSGQRSRTSTVADGTHITPEGYAALTEYAQPILEGHFTGSGR